MHNDANLCISNFPSHGHGNPVLYAPTPVELDLDILSPWHSCEQYHSLLHRSFVCTLHNAQDTGTFLSQPGEAVIMGSSFWRVMK